MKKILPKAHNLTVIYNPVTIDQIEVNQMNIESFERFIKKSESVLFYDPSGKPIGGQSICEIYNINYKNKNAIVCKLGNQAETKNEEILQMIECQFGKLCENLSPNIVANYEVLIQSLEHTSCFYQIEEVVIPFNATKTDCEKNIAIRLQKINM